MKTAIRNTLGGLALLMASLSPAAHAAEVLRIAVNPIYPPLEFRDPVKDTLTGFDIDFGTALATRMGMTVEWVETSFPQMIPSVQSGRTDVILSGFSDLPKRRSLLNFIPYLWSGAQVLVRADDSVATAQDLCGKTVAASRATSFPLMIQEWSKKNCTAKHLPAMSFYPSESGADARIQLLQGRVAAMVQGRETVGYFMKMTNNAFRQLGSPLSHMTLAIAFPKNAQSLEKKMQNAFAQMKVDGSYATLLEKWSLSKDAIETAEGASP